MARGQKTYRDQKVKFNLFLYHSFGHMWAQKTRRKRLCHLAREVDVVLKYLKEQCGAKDVGVVGFCWGGVATHYIALQYPEIKAGVSVYGNALFFLNSQPRKKCGKMSVLQTLCILSTQVLLEREKTGLI